MKYVLSAALVLGFSFSVVAKNEATNSNWEEETVDMGPPAVEDLRADLASMKQDSGRAPASVTPEQATTTDSALKSE